MSFWSILLLLLETQNILFERGGGVVGPEKTKGTTNIFFTFKNILLLFYFTKKKINFFYNLHWLIHIIIIIVVML